MRTAADPDDPADVLTLDERRLASLEEVFWDMNAIDFEVQERRVEEIVEVEREDGTVAEGTETVTRRVLVVTLSARSPDEAAASYGFTAEQADMLAQLLDERYAAMWQSVLYGVTGGSGDIVEVAASQIGNVGGQPYWSWYGFSGRVEWCACFVSWCANECGYIEAGAVPKFAACSAGVQWFKSAGLWHDRGYEPRPGDIVFFDWGGDDGADHVGIVESCDGSTVHTIEGNTSDSCARRSYGIGSASILGYGTPLY
ncbi:C40 family peptidase [Olsenella sp. An285]|uniref:C40 family peptidase n=1 Tax=Olsenella sp. An285 TaxID=1965621 RepID=UPI0019D0F635|nr:CHAP domain-containing protein [Olsenella sp. An285]